MHTDKHQITDALAPLRGRSIGVAGYGNQGRAQALNLRDAGLTVSVGGRAGGASAERAAADGFDTLPSARDLGDACDIVALLAPDEAHGEVLASLLPGGRIRSVVFAHGYTLRFEAPPLDAAWDVLLVAPSGPGTALRREDGPGRIPALIAVHQDASGEAWSLARAYAVAAGCSVRALVETTVAEEAEVDLFGEQAVLCGGLAALVTAAWETLVAAGYDPEVAYVECVQQVGLTAEMITRHGVSGMRERVSPLALYGDLTRGPRLIDAKVRRAMAEILGEIRDGRFAAEWAEEVRAGKPLSRSLLDESRRHPREQAGRRVRDLARRSASDGCDEAQVP